MKTLTPNRYSAYTKEWWAIAALFAGVACMAYGAGESVMQRYLGQIYPLWIFISVGLLGTALLIYLLQCAGLALFRPGRWQGLWRFLILALLFGGNAILIDLNIVFPADINVPFPTSLLFYPAIDFFVQIVFHVLPLALLLPILTSIFESADQDRLAWILVPAVAMLEPAYQAIYMHDLGTYSLWAVVVVGVHVYLINIFELWVYKYYDFVAMYLFRLLFYGVWHIAWGHARLSVLY